MQSGKSVKVLFGVSSVGLGHARRSLAIARELRKLSETGFEFDFDWLAAEPALSFLQANGERVLEVSSRMKSLSMLMEKGSNEGRIRSIVEIARESSTTAKENYELIRPILGDFDVLIQDEFWETLFSFIWDPSPPLPRRRAVITDFTEFESDSINPVNRIELSYINKSLKKAFANQQVKIFAEEADALPGDRGARKWALKNFQIIGPVVDDLPVRSKKELKKALLGGEEGTRYILFTVGGTSIGKELFQIAAKEANRMSEVLDSHFVLLLGPRIDPKNVFQGAKSARVAVVPFRVNSMEYFKAADCVVAQAGGSTLNEVASLGIPCVAIPIGNHFEQKRNAKRFGKRFGFEVLNYEDLSGPSLINAIQNAIANKRQGIPPAKAAKRAAGIIFDLATLVTDGRLLSL